MNARMKLVASVMHCMPIVGVKPAAFLVGPNPASVLFGQRPAFSILLQLQRSGGMATGGGRRDAGSRRSVWGGRGGSGKGSRVSATELLAKLEAKLEEDDGMDVKWRDLNQVRKQAIPAEMVGEYGETVANHAREQTYKSYQRLVSGLRDNVPSNMRSAVVAERIHGLANKKFGTKGKQLCGGCWLPNYLCVCGAGDALSREAVDAFPHRIIVYMHVKEIGRSSNTGVLARLALGEDKVEILVSEVRAHEERMDQILADAEPERLLVLFPSEGSISTDDYARKSQLSFDKGLTIIVCDGTWRQARRLDKRFGPSVRRVRLTDERLASHVDRDLSSPMRTQAGFGRVCSVTALAFFLREMSHDDTVPSRFMSLLHDKAEAVLRGREWKSAKLEAAD